MPVADTSIYAYKTLNSKVTDCDRVMDLFLQFKELADWEIEDLTGIKANEVSARRNDINNRLGDRYDYKIVDTKRGKINPHTGKPGKIRILEPKNPVYQQDQFFLPY